MEVKCFTWNIISLFFVIHAYNIVSVLIKLPLKMGSNLSCVMI